MQKAIPFDSSKIEAKWQARWGRDKLFSPSVLSAKKPFYNLMMFPYPSAGGLHVGNMYAFTGADVFGRYMRMKDYDVFEPIGLDGFGIHSENYAIKVDQHPMELAKKTEARFYKQLHLTGNSYDWTKTLETYDPKYYKWTQWIFTKMFKEGLAYRAEAPVNWCPSCKTVLADEQVIAGKCERCGSQVTTKKLEQWFFRLATGVRPNGKPYPEALLENLKKIDWSNKVKIAQRNWIGRSEGAIIRFKIVDSDDQIPVFTTRPDTLYGATFLVLSPDSDWVEQLTKKENAQKVSKYIQTSRESRFRSLKSKEKTGVFTGSYVINPATGSKIPVWVADYVVAGYGSGAIMGVPSHDERDKEFAYVFKIPIKKIKPDDGLWREIEEKGWGERFTNFHLRDWLISRQRYWGPPIPMIYCEKCAAEGKGERRDIHGWYSVDESDLPVELPYVKEYRPKGKGVSPLATDESFYKVKCPGCGGSARRETDVSDTFLDSVWYYLRYPSVGEDKAAWDPIITKKWLPVNMYIGGAEHAVLHLFYARFIAMALKDMGIIDFEEPFARFYAHGLLIKEGAKMSKSKGNIVVPDTYIGKYGADTLRCYLMFLGPFDAGGNFRDTGIEGMRRFIDRVWSLINQYSDLVLVNEKDSKEVSIKMHQTIKKVTEDIENLRYNTAISAIMEYVNLLRDKTETEVKRAASGMHCAEWDEAIRTLALLIAPFAPHIAEEAWVNVLGEGFSVHKAAWPKFDLNLIKEEQVEFIVQVNGKLRGQLKVGSRDSQNKAKMESMAKSDAKVSSWIVKGSIKKVVFVPGRLINFVLD
jgi:leucyl-tRNA synthetase